MSDINHLTEQDMNQIRTWFARGADALVNASELSRKFEGMEKTMADLKQSYDEIAANNRFLIRQITDLETELGQVKTERDETKRELSTFNQRLAQRDDEIAEFHKSHNEQADTIVRLRRESDEHMMRALKAEETVDTIKTQFSKVKNVYEDMAKVFDDVSEVLYPPAETFLQPTSQPTEQVALLPVGDQTPDSTNAMPETVPVSGGAEVVPLKPEVEEPSQPMPWLHGIGGSGS